MRPLDAFFAHPAPARPGAPDPPDPDGSPALLAALACVADAVFVVDTAWRFVYLNAHAAGLLVRPRAALLGAVAWDAFPELVGTRFESECRRAVATGVPAAFEAPYPGAAAWYAVRAHPSPAGLVVYGRDITARLAVEADLRLREHLLDQVEVAVIATDVDGRVTHWNAHAARLYGWSRAEATGRPVGELTVGPRDPAATAATWARLRAGLPWSGEFTARRRDGTTFPAHVTDAPIRDAEGRLVGVVGVSADITARKGLEAALEHRATHDALTGLPNRALFLDRLGHALARRDGATCAVLFLDLDHFKAVNDRYGHGAGDALLVAVAARLGGAVRPGDTLARLGGDEFTLLVEGIGGAGEAAAVAGRLAAALADPFAIGGRETTVAASIGLALARPGHARPEDVLRDADWGCPVATDTR